MGTRTKRPATRASRQAGRLRGLLTAGIVLFALAASRPAQAQNFSVIHSFGLGTDGANPVAGLIADSAGNLYGTTSNGGEYGYGTVFELEASGGEEVLYSFMGGPDGATPFGGLLRTPTGTLYGTTIAGGSFAGACPSYGCGVVFELSRAGEETVLHTFTGGLDGIRPNGSLITDGKGNLYGTAATGGAYGSGVVFEIDRAGTETTLYSFTGGVDGAFPAGSLIIDVLGNLYGAAEGGVRSPHWAGNETVLYTFLGGADGKQQPAV